MTREHFGSDLARCLHYLAHLLGRNNGSVEAWWQGDHLFVGFRCSGCGDLRHTYDGGASRPGEVYEADS